jgi:hypothetical protein
LYGSFGTVVAANGNLILFGKTSAGIFQATVSPGNIQNRGAYSYYDASTKAYTKTIPSPSNVAAAIVTGAYNGGDFFYSAFYGTWLFIYFDNYADSTFYIRYSTSGTTSGPWSSAQVLYKTKPSSSVYNYGAHAYWMPWSTTDANGEVGASNTVLLSWTYDGGYTQMAKVTFS